MDKKEIRKKFRSDVLKRDDNTCRVCGVQLPDEELDAHHITDRKEMPNGGYVKENGITVCKERCHMRVEKFHISDNMDWWDGLHPDDLYKEIDSSYEEAYLKSEAIK